MAGQGSPELLARCRWCWARDHDERNDCTCACGRHRTDAGSRKEPRVGLVPWLEAAAVMRSRSGRTGFPCQRIGGGQETCIQNASCSTKVLRNGTPMNWRPRTRNVVRGRRGRRTARGLRPPRTHPFRRMLSTKGEVLHRRICRDRRFAKTTSASCREAGAEAAG